MCIQSDILFDLQTWGNLRLFFFNPDQLIKNKIGSNLPMHLTHLSSASCQPLEGPTGKLATLYFRLALAGNATCVALEFSIASLPSSF